MEEKNTASTATAAQSASATAAQAATPAQSAQAQPASAQPAYAVPAANNSDQNAKFIALAATAATGIMMLLPWISYPLALGQAPQYSVWHLPFALYNRGDIPAITSCGNSFYQTDLCVSVLFLGIWGLALMQICDGFYRVASGEEKFGRLFETNMVTAIISALYLAGCYFMNLYDGGGNVTVFEATVWPWATLLVAVGTILLVLAAEEAAKTSAAAGAVKPAAATAAVKSTAANPSKAATETTEEKPKAGSYCANCGSKLMDGAKFCPQCGTKRGEVEPKHEEPKQPEVHRCPSCDYVLAQNAAFCGNCGHAL